MAISILTKADDDKVFEVVVDDAVFYVKPMSNTAMTKLRLKHTATKRGVETVDADAMYYDRFDKTVVDWREGDILDSKGVPLVCDSENKRMLADKNTRIASEVLRQTDLLDGEAKEAAAKN